MSAAPDQGRQVALVTGASRGIGQAIARTLAAAGMAVVGTATTDAGAEAIGNALAGFEGCRGIRLDVNDGAAVEAAIDAIVADGTGIELHPLFGTKTSFRWDEVRSIGVRDVRAARGHGPALVVDASEEREAKIDGLWVGATRGNLRRMADRLEEFAASTGIAGPSFVAAPEPEPW